MPGTQKGVNKCQFSCPSQRSVCFPTGRMPSGQLGRGFSDLDVIYTRSPGDPVKMQILMRRSATGRLCQPTGLPVRSRELCRRDGGHPGGALTVDPLGACCPVAWQGLPPSFSKVCSLLFPLPAQVQTQQETEQARLVGSGLESESRQRNRRNKARP